MVDSKICFSEVHEVLKYLAKEDYEKIPKDVIETIDNLRNKEYTWKYDMSKQLKDQNMSREAFAILSYINMQYLLDDDEKELMTQFHRLNDQKDEIRKQKLYNVDNIFKNKNNNEVQKNDVVEENTSMMEYKESFIKKIFNKIKNFFVAI